MGADLSAIIVNFKSARFLRHSLESLREDRSPYLFDVWVVDNGSAESLADLRHDFPNVHWIINPQNVGFAKAVNQALRVANGRYFLLLNPDTRVMEGTIGKMAEFLEQNPEIGIAGGQLLYPDGSRDPASHRSIPTPSTAFYRLSGLSRIFPKNSAFGRYNRSELDPNTGAFVDAVSGACMMLRRTMLDDIGLLDERFFLYGEDLDLCYRAKLDGWKTYYLPDAQVVHFKRGSSRRNRIRSHYEFHRAMALFHAKHFAGSYGTLLNTMVYAGIWGRAFLYWPVTFVRREKEP